MEEWIDISFPKSYIIYDFFEVVVLMYCIVYISHFPSVQLYL